MLGTKVLFAGLMSGEHRNVISDRNATFEDTFAYSLNDSSFDALDAQLCVCQSFGSVLFPVVIWAWCVRNSKNIMQLIIMRSVSSNNLAFS